MKKLMYISALAAWWFTSSCNHQLELAPENTLVDREVFNTQGGAEQALAEGYYDLLRAVMDNDAYIYGDVTTPELLHTVYYDTYDLGQASPTDPSVVGIWTNYFQAVNTVNNVISKIPLYAKFPAATRDQFIAEAKFIRAYAYLDLLKFYGDGALSGKTDGLGLPLQLTPFAGYHTGQIIPRSTNGEVYAQIIKDLTEALPSLPDRQTGGDLSTRSRATKGSANALLARAYLYMRRYENAAAAAKLVIDKTDIYSPTTDLYQLFPPDPGGTAQTLTPEYVFALPVSQMVSSSTSISYGPGYGYYLKNNYWINPAFANSFETGDKRVSQLMYKGDTIYNYQPAYLTTFKFNNPNGRDNISLIRLAEVMLTRAEALARTEGVNDASIALLNTVKNRSVTSATPYVSGDFSDANTLVATILRQRDFELAFESHHRYDLIRTDRPLHTPDLPADRKVLPIPQSEIDISAGVIKQNTGY
ncbi:MAG: RagB/SusD family nutrient uptake outer membrane protein [Chitinophagaceae bacterium]|nr:RagB/SusD family nutrient uptake outer membrane protein [Chitinophagaceae bacterium]